MPGERLDRSPENGSEGAAGRAQSDWRRMESEQNARNLGHTALKGDQRGRVAPEAGRTAVERSTREERLSRELLPDREVRNDERER